MSRSLDPSKWGFWKASSGGSCFLNGTQVACFQITLSAPFRRDYFSFCHVYQLCTQEHLDYLIITVLPDHLMDAAQQKS